MRLSREEVDAIRQAIRLRDPAARIYLFGSRADDTRRGGDIDLLILSERLRQDDAFLLRADLWESVGEQKIDLVITGDRDDPFVKVVLPEAVEL